MNLEERVNLSIFTHEGIKTFVRLEFPSLKKTTVGVKVVSQILWLD